MQQIINSVGREVLPLHSTQQQIRSYPLGKAVKIIWDRLNVSFSEHHSGRGRSLTPLLLRDLETVKDIWKQLHSYLVLPLQEAIWGVHPFDVPLTSNVWEMVNFSLADILCILGRFVQNSLKCKFVSSIQRSPMSPFLFDLVYTAW